LAVVEKLIAFSIRQIDRMKSDADFSLLQCVNHILKQMSGGQRKIDTHRFAGIHAILGRRRGCLGFRENTESADEFSRGTFLKLHPRIRVIDAEDGIEDGLAVFKVNSELLQNGKIGL